MIFTQSYHCLSRAHCNSCRNDIAWRERVGAPSECPFGVQSDWKRPTKDEIQRMRMLCAECEHSFDDTSKPDGVGGCALLKCKWNSTLTTGGPWPANCLHATNAVKEPCNG